MHSRFPFTMSWCRCYFFFFGFSLSHISFRQREHNKKQPLQRTQQKTHERNSLLSARFIILYMLRGKSLSTDTIVSLCYMHMMRVHKNGLHIRFGPFLHSCFSLNCFDELIPSQRVLRYIIHLPITILAATNC